MGAFPSVGLCYSLQLYGAVEARFHRPDCSRWACVSVGGTVLQFIAIMVPYGRVSVGQVTTFLWCRMGAFPSVKVHYEV